MKSFATSPDGDFLNLGDSTTVFRLRGGVSGGTIASFLTAIEQVPRKDTIESNVPYILSPFVGLRTPRPRFVYSLPVPGGKTIKGGVFFMAATNTQLVRRTFGLLELQAKEGALIHSNPLPVPSGSNNLICNAAGTKEARAARYGPDFRYQEFMGTSGTLSAFALTAALVFSFGIMLIRPVSFTLIVCGDISQELSFRRSVPLLRNSYPSQERVLRTSECIMDS